MKTLKDKVAVITGAGSGIGRALAIRFAAEGAWLALLDRDATSLAETVAECPTAQPPLALRVDVAQRETVEAAAEAVASHFGRIDIVINNAGVSSSGTIGELTYETLAWTLEVNFWGVVHGTKAFLPHLLARPEANLVNVSSVYGLIGVPGQAAYCAAKFAVRGFTEAVRQDLRGSPVAVSVVFPGGVRTRIVENSRSDSTRPAEEQQRLRQRFEAALRTSPAAAAEAIARGIRRNAPRILIGRDAGNIDLLARLVPDRYDGVVARQAARLAAPSRPALHSKGGWL